MLIFWGVFHLVLTAVLRWITQGWSSLVQTVDVEVSHYLVLRTRSNMSCTIGYFAVTVYSMQSKGIFMMCPIELNVFSPKFQLCVNSMPLRYDAYFN